jgi:MFS family permease
MPKTFRALKHRNFQLFFVGQLTSLIGTWMQTIAQSWLVYRLTNSPAQLGGVGFCSQIPILLLATLGGMVADRFPRRRVLLVTQTISMILAFALSALTLSGTIQIWHIYFMAISLGTVNAFDIPGRQAFVVEMVGKKDLSNAIALNSTMFNGARILGPALAGILVAEIGEGWCFALNGLSFLAVILSLLAMRLQPHTPNNGRGSLAHQLGEGFRYVRQAPPIYCILLLLGVVSLTGMPYAVLMPIFADQILHGGPRGLGLLMGSTGIGALGGALTLASRESIDGLPRWVARAACGFGVSILLFSNSSNFWLSALLLLPTGYCMMIQMASSNTLVQSLVPDALRGRVMAIYSMTFMGMGPFGSLLAGALAHRFGAPYAVGLGGLVCILGALLFSTQLSVIRAEMERTSVLEDSSSPAGTGFNPVSRELERTENG